MAFEYGSSGLDIKNPFRFEGLLYILRGLAVAVLGGLLVYSLRGGIEVQGVADEDLARALILIKLAVGAFLLAMGLTALGIGLFKALRFYVGRGSPADLVSPILNQADLATMLRKRTNPTFVEPEGLLTRLVHGIFPRLLFMPWPVRVATVRLATGLYYSFLVLLVLGLAVFSGTIGLTPIGGAGMVGWLTLIAAVALLGIWIRICPLRRNEWLNASRLPEISIKSTVLLVVGAILLPVILATVAAEAEIPPPPLSGGLWLLFLTLAGIIVTAAGGVLAYLRMEAARARTEVSEYRQHWSESLHPMDIFRAFDMVMADHRFLEIPNREYHSADAHLNLQGSADKGDFKGETLVEIQPQPSTLELPPLFATLRTAVLVAAHVVMLVAAVWLYAGVAGLEDISVQSLNGAVAVPLVLWLFGSIAGRIANLYIAEVPFHSHMIHFFAEGTYTESKISTGMAITDSTRSENVLVRSSLTPWVFLSSLQSSTFAVSGSLNLEQLRYVLDMSKDDSFLARIVEDLRRFIDSRQVIADVRSDSDFQSAGSIHRINAAARGQDVRPEIGIRPEDREQPKALDLDTGPDDTGRG